MTTENNGTSPSEDEVENPAEDPRVPESAEEDKQRTDPVESGPGPDSENVDGESEAENAKETGGYGY